MLGLTCEHHAVLSHCLQASEFNLLVHCSDKCVELEIYTWHTQQTGFSGVMVSHHIETVGRQRIRQVASSGHDGGTPAETRGISPRHRRGGGYDKGRRSRAWGGLPVSRLRPERCRVSEQRNTGVWQATTLHPFLLNQVTWWIQPLRVAS